MPLIVSETTETQTNLIEQTIPLFNIQNQNEYGLIVLFFLFLIVIFRNPLFSLLIGILKTSIIVGVLYLAYKFIF
jgi:hypothetical protein